MSTLRERLHWLRPSVKREAILWAILAQGDRPWYSQDVLRAARPPWSREFLWAHGTFTVLTTHLEAQGAFEMGWEPVTDRRPRLWHRVVSEEPILRCLETTAR